MFYWPRHPEKAVARKETAEVQGAMVDGIQGVTFPKKGRSP